MDKSHGEKKNRNQIGTKCRLRSIAEFEICVSSLCSHFFFCCGPCAFWAFLIGCVKCKRLCKECCIGSKTANIIKTKIKTQQNIHKIYIEKIISVCVCFRFFFFSFSSANECSAFVRRLQTWGQRFAYFADKYAFVWLQQRCVKYRINVCYAQCSCSTICCGMPSHHVELWIHSVCNDWEDNYNIKRPREKKNDKQLETKAATTTTTPQENYFILLFSCSA